VEPARFGTGAAQRRQLTLEAADSGHLGGPFDLNQAVKPTADTEDEDNTAAAAD
jgi:hypothetical protein